MGFRQGICLYALTVLRQAQKYRFQTGIYNSFRPNAVYHLYYKQCRLATQYHRPPYLVTKETELERSHSHAEREGVVLIHYLHLVSSTKL